MVAEGSEGLPALVQSYIHPLGAQELPGALLLKLALVLDKCRCYLASGPESPDEPGG